MNPKYQKTRNFSILSILVMLTLFLAACSPSAAAPTDTAVPTMMAATATTAAAAVNTPTGPATLKVAQNAALGSFLTDSNGMTLYAYAKDSSGVSTCTSACLANWPALLTNGAPTAGDPAITGTLGTLTRTDGAMQVTYNGAPLYTFIKDKAPGDTNGQGVGSVWAVVPPAPAAMTSTAAATSAATMAASGPATLKVAADATLGSILVDASGKTLYIYTKDSSGVSTCTGGCATNWPPVLTTGAPVAGDPAITGTLGTIKLADGTLQVTINGMPLYTYSGDQAPGDTKGQAVGGVWYAVMPSGTPKQ